MMHNLFNDLHERSRQFADFEELLNGFVSEMVDTTVALTCKHYFTKNPFSDLPGHLQLDLERIKQVMQSQELFKIFGYMIVKEIIQISEDYAETDTPENNGVRYTKKEYPVYNAKRIKEELILCLDEFCPKNEQEKEILKHIIAKQIAQKEFNQEYEKVLYKELKKLAVKYFPGITEISGNGLRQVDYMLQDHTQRITERCRATRKEIWDLISSSVEQQD